MLPAIAMVFPAERFSGVFEVMTAGGAAPFAGFSSRVRAFYNPLRIQIWNNAEMI
jgi:hypothetical protein